MLLAADVIAPRLIDDVAVHKRRQIFFNRAHVELPPVGAHRIRNFLGGNRAARAAVHEPQNAFQHHRIGVFQSPHDVLQHDRVIDAAQVFLNRLPVAAQLGGIGKARLQIAAVCGAQAVPAARKRRIFRKGERQHINGDVAPRKMRRQLAGQHVGVRAGQVEIQIFAQKEAVDHRRKIPDILNFIQKDIRPFVSRARQNISVQLHRVAQLDVGEVLQIDGDDLRIGNAVKAKLRLKQFHQRRFSAAPNPRNHLDHLFVLPTPERSKVLRSINHANPPPLRAPRPSASSRLLNHFIQKHL